MHYGIAGLLYLTMRYPLQRGWGDSEVIPSTKNSMLAWAMAGIYLTAGNNHLLVPPSLQTALHGPPILESTQSMHMLLIKTNDVGVCTTICMEINPNSPASINAIHGYFEKSRTAMCVVTGTQRISCSSREHSNGLTTTTKTNAKPGDPVAKLQKYPPPNPSSYFKSWSQRQQPPSQSGHMIQATVRYTTRELFYRRHRYIASECWNGIINRNIEMPILGMQ